MKKPRVRLVKMRTDRKLKQRDVAAGLNITTSYYGMIETGERTPDFELSGKIAVFFGVSNDVLYNIFFGDSDNETLINEQTEFLPEAANV